MAGNDFLESIAELERDADAQLLTRRERDADQFGLDEALLEAVGPVLSRRMIAQPAIDMIVASEVTSKAHYEQKLQSPIWPEGRSGVTIGIGYDVGTVDEQTMTADWAGVLDDATLSRLAKTCTITGPSAASFIRALADIRVPFDGAMRVFLARSLPLFVGQTERALPNTALLGPECLGALTSLVYNRGAPFQRPGDRYREMRAIRDHMADKAFKLIPGELRTMKRIWQGDPNSAGLLLRREAEAALFERGLAGNHPVAPAVTEGVAEAAAEAPATEGLISSVLGWLKPIVETPTRDRLMFRIAQKGPPIEADEHYVEIRVLSARIVNARRWTSLYHGAVHATVNLLSEGEGTGRVERQVILTPEQFRNLDPGGQGKVIQIDRPVLGPTPYRGDLRLSIALFSVKSSDLAAPYLTLLSKLSQNTALGFLAAAHPFVEPLREATGVLFGATDSASLECGTVRGFGQLTADTWVCIGATQDEIPDWSGFSLDPDNFRLRDGNGTPLEEFPYLVFRVDRSERRDDWLDLPTLKAAWDAVSTALRSGKAEEARAAALAFRRACFAGGDLLPNDARRLADKADAKLAQALNASAGATTETPRTEALASFTPHDLGFGALALYDDVTPNSGDDEAAEPEVAMEGVEEGVASWRVARSLDVLLRQVNVTAPSRSKQSDGAIGDAAHATRNSDHNPWVRDHGIGVVTARDFTHDPAGGCDAGILAQSLVGSRDPRIKYVIWNRQIASAAMASWTWRPYNGVNPHDHHVHVSVVSEKHLFDDEGPWTIRVK